jgi:hypothetical protein
MTKPTRTWLTYVALALLAPVAAARADNDISDTAVKRADTFFKTAQRGKAILNALHFGARYDGHTCKEYTKVQGSDGKIVPGHFCLVYDFKWAGTGETRVGLFCDERGTFYASKVLKSNAVLSQPFAVAKLSIKVLGEAMLEALKNDLKENDKKAMRKLIDAADPKGLLETSLKLQQAFGR